MTSDARSVVATSFSLLNLVDGLQNAESVQTLADVLQELPDESFDLLINVTKDVVTQLIPADESYQVIVDTLLKALDQLPDLRSKLTAAEYSEELRAISDVAAMLSDPSAYTDEEIIKTVLSSSVLTSTILENSDELAEIFADSTKELTEKEKEEIKDAVNNYADEIGVDDEIVSSLLSVFGIS